MAEETPGNLGSMFGGWMSGRAAGSNRKIDASIDRLDAAINRFVDALDRASGTFGKQAKSRAGNGGSTQQSQSSAGNGGNPTFGGKHAGEAGGLINAVAGIGGTGGSHRGPTPNGGGADGAGLRYAYGQVGGAGGIAKGVGAAAVTMGAVYTANHASSSIMGQAIAAQWAGGPNWNAAYQRGMRNNYSASSTTDFQRSANMMAQNGGYTMGSAGYRQAMGQMGSVSYVNPQISNAQSTQASLSIASPGSFNRLQGLGINPMGHGAMAGTGDPRSLARQILAKIPGISNVKNQQQVAAMFGPSGSATVTVNGMVSGGFIPADSSQVVLSEMRNIMQARVNGMNFTAYNKAATTAATASPGSHAGGAARDALHSAGLANTSINMLRDKEGMKRESEAETIKGFTAGLNASTKVLEKFRGALNAILGIPGVGEAVGGASGVTTGIPGVGALLGKLGVGGKLGGGILKSILGAAAGGTAPGMSSAQFGGGGGSGFAPSSQIGGGFGGVAMTKQAGASNSSGGGGGGGHATQGAASKHGTAGIKLIAPRPGIDSMSSEQDFGKRTIGQGFHTGIDLQGGVGAPIKAAAGGTVTAAGWGASGDGGYGNVTVIDHGNGWKTMYAHQSSISKHKGRQVRQGEIIGAVGNTGRYSQGAHLHFELWHHGKPVDPAPYIRGARKIQTSGSTASTSGGGGGGGGAASGAAAATAGLGIAGTSQTLGSTASNINAISGGGGGGGGAYGAFSEVAALGIGSGSSQGGPTGGGSDPGLSPTGSAGSAGSGSGAAGSVSGGGFGPGGPGSAKVATFNIHTSSVSASGAEADLRKVMGTGVGAISLQEFYYKHKAAPIPGWLAQQGWGLYKGPTGTSVTWDKSKYSGSNFGSYDLNTKYKMPKTISQRYAAYALLTDKATGAKFWQISAHLIPQPPRAPVSQGLRDAMWREQVQRLNALQQRLKRSAPVVVGADFNDNGSNFMTGMSADHSRGIDSIFGTKGKVSQRGSQFVGGLNSDHNALIASLGIGGATGQHATSSAGNTGNSGNGVSTGLTGNRRIVNQVAAKYGWGRGAEWNALVNLVNSESGFRNTAQNPTSTAYGMFQFLNSTWKGYKYGKTSDPYKQAVDGLQYVKGRYGDPIKAWNFHKSHNWYAMGEWNIRNDQDARVHKGEMILPTKVAEAVRDSLSAPGIRDVLGGGKRGGGGAVITFQTGSIQVSMGGNPSAYDMTRAGRGVVDAIMEDQRMKALAGGI